MDDEKTSSKLSFIGGVSVSILEKLLLGPIPVINGVIVLSQILNPTSGFFSNREGYNGCDSRYHYRWNTSGKALLSYALGVGIVYSPQIIEMINNN